MVNESLKRFTDHGSNPLRFACAGDQNHDDLGPNDDGVAAAHLLGKRERGSPDLGAVRDDLKQIVQARRLQIIDLDAADDEDLRLALFGIGEALVMNAEQPDEIGTAPLDKLEEVGVVDQARNIRVLEIDTDGKKWRSTNV